MKMEYIGHKTEDGREQPLIDHLKNVSQLAGQFAAVFGEKEMGEQVGLYHDIGKYSLGFQNRIMNDGPKVDHSTAGAQEMIKVKNPVMAFCIAGHHSGLMDRGSRFSVDSDGTLQGRLKKDLKGKLAYDSFLNELSVPSSFNPNDKNKTSNSFGISFYTRMLFSSLVDADFLDTEIFMSEGKVSRGSSTTMDELKTKFDIYCEKFTGCEGVINQKRQEIRNECIKKAGEKHGLFSLTVPTGGGKTLSSLAFALNHAVGYNKERIIYVIPYTSIIEQTADIFRDILGDENVIEHHMNVDYDDNENLSTGTDDYKKLATENWDAPIIVTTNVQFFESLFANKSSRCRKLHNIANSVVIFDEAQMLPVDYLKPCMEAIKELVVNYGVTEVLCTATQPSLNKFVEPYEIREICNDTQGLYEFFRRVRYEQLKVSSLEDVASKLNQYKQVLCIINSKKDAQELYGMLTGEGCFHLSTLMYPNHRRQVLRVIRERLNNCLPCKVISTSLIEAGVDVDFPVVFREVAGLDSCIQAGGRCNREGKNSSDDSIVYLYDLERNVTKIPSFIRQPLGITQGLLKKYKDVAGLDVIKKYFDDLHYFKRDDLDKKKILDETNDFKFATVAKKFKLIEENTKSLFINNTEESNNILECLQCGIRSRTLLRQAGKFIVPIYENQLRKLLDLGKIEAVDQELYLLIDDTAYSDKTGLKLEMDDGVGVFL